MNAKRSPQWTRPAWTRAASAQPAAQAVLKGSRGFSRAMEGWGGWKRLYLFESIYGSTVVYQRELTFDISKAL